MTIPTTPGHAAVVLVTLACLCSLGLALPGCGPGTGTADGDADLEVVAAQIVAQYQRTTDCTGQGLVFSTAQIVESLQTLHAQANPSTSLLAFAEEQLQFATSQADANCGVDTSQNDNDNSADATNDNGGP